MDVIFIALCGVCQYKNTLYWVNSSEFCHILYACRVGSFCLDLCKSIGEFRIQKTGDRRIRMSLCSGKFNNSVNPFIRSSRGYTPVHTAPRPRACAARSKFCVAAEQSTTQYPGAVSISRFPHTKIPKGACKIICENGETVGTLALISGSDITINSQGC